MSAPLLRVENLHKHFVVRGGLLGRPVATLAAVAGVSFAIAPGRTLGLVGESGCGKSTLGRTIVRLYEATSGEVYLDGERITRLSWSEMRSRRRTLQMIFQDPHASLDPRYTVARTLREPLDVHALGAPAGRNDRVRDLLRVVGLGAQMLERYPHELSGGQRQRVGIARALALEPKLIVADEPVSSLDVTVRAQVLDLLAGLQRERGIAYLFISHDLAVVRHVSHDVAVMYLGKIVEQAATDALYRTPKHPYTRALLSAVPTIDAGAQRERIVLGGEVPSPLAPPSGCPFHPRCPQALAVCAQVEPPAIDVGEPGNAHFVRCHLYGAQPVPT
jgi:oligopeptide/dipeptide ABC transporter ATP-binding protein